MNMLRATYALMAPLAALFLIGQAPAQELPEFPDIPPEIPEVRLPLQLIRIVNMGPYYPLSTDAVEGRWHNVYVSTNISFSQVKWYVNGELKWTDEGSYNSTDSFFGFQYNGLGSTTGNDVTVKAVAYCWAMPESEPDSEEMTLTVWEPIRITGVSIGRKYVAGEEISVSVHTNMPAEKIEYSVDGGEMEEVGSEFTHVFLGNEGSREGSPHTIEIAAHAKVVGRDTSSESTHDLKVFADIGFVWRRTVTRIEGVSWISGNQFVLKTNHTIEYYSDRITRFNMRRRAAWKEDGVQQETNRPPDQSNPASKTFFGSVSLPMGTFHNLKNNSEYDGTAYTNMNGNERADAETESNTRYNENDPPGFQAMFPSKEGDKKNGALPPGLDLD